MVDMLQVVFLLMGALMGALKNTCKEVEVKAVFFH
jgi:hypothetical protein